MTAGDKLGPYEITALLGKGGMGEVYRATDTRLHRDVAIKVSAEQFSDRFEKEARAVAALNHPNICTLHDVGPNYLVMELVEGETLADQIKRGPIPLDEALTMARQITGALEAAHEKGITHRDLKPANIKITPEGTVKVLDFGLAKIAEPVSQPGSDPEHSPTLTLEAATRLGTIMGTAGYMAPEQAKGKSVDKRADIWAFGVVLYEMVTGKRLFAGEDLTDTLAMVVRDTPDLSAAPAKLRRLLRRCLEKDPKKRRRDIGDVWELLEEPAVSLDTAPSRSPLGWLPWAVAVVFVALAALLAFVHFREAAPELQAVHFTMQPPPGTQFTSPFCGYGASPDGRYVVFSTGGGQPAGGDQGQSLWLRSLDSGTSRPLAGTAGGNCPTWSPDSQSLAFYVDGQLKRIDIAGGAPLPLGAANSTGVSPTGTWSRDGVILIGSPTGLQKLSASGGGATQLTKVDPAQRETGHGYPQFLPRGDRFLYFVASDDPKVQGVYASSLSNPGRRSLIARTEAKAVYIPPLAAYPGYLLWVQDATLVARRFNPDTLEFEGEPATVAEGIAVTTSHRASFWASDAGLLVYRALGGAGDRVMRWHSTEGQRLGEVGPKKDYRDIRLSPDGGRAAVTIRDQAGNDDIWLFDFGRQGMTRLTFDPGADDNPVWSPDGRQIAFSSDRSHIRQIYRKNASGAGAAEQLTHGPNPKYVTDWSRDGRYLLYSEDAPGAGSDVWALPLDGDRKPQPVLQTRFQERHAVFAPGGNWIAYSSDESGPYEIYVQAFPSSGGKWQVSNQSGVQPNWSRDGSEVFYLAYVGRFAAMAARIRATGASVESETPRALVALTPAGFISSHTFDVAPDGRRIIGLEGVGGEVEVPLTVVSNWQAGLKK